MTGAARPGNGPAPEPAARPPVPVRPAWDAPAGPWLDEARLADAEAVLADAAPIDLARDVIAGRIEADRPGWVVGHGLAGWTAVWMADPRYRIRAQSSVELQACLPRRDQPPRWDLS